MILNKKVNNLQTNIGILIWVWIGISLPFSAWFDAITESSLLPLTQLPPELEEWEFKICKQILSDLQTNIEWFGKNIELFANRYWRICKQILDERDKILSSPFYEEQTDSVAANEKGISVHYGEVAMGIRK